MKLFKIIILFTLLYFLPGKTNAQENWVFYSKTINVKDYGGDNFRLVAMVRSEPQDDSASARLWVRADKKNGMGFFDNMWDKPIRNEEWKTYSIDGKIDTGAYQLAFGALCQYNGKFYYDDIKLDVETSKGKWKTIFTDDFENNSDTLERGQYGFNNDYTATITDAGNKSKVLLIEGNNVPNYGVNNKVGKFADVNGIKMYYEIYGSGKPLLMIHGNGGSIDAFTKTIPYFSKKYKVIAVDSRAQGRSEDDNDSLSFEMMADDFASLLDTLHIDSAYVIGWSDGGINALLLAIRHPEKVIKLAATGANITPDSTAFAEGVWQDSKRYYDTSYNKTWKTKQEKNAWKLFLLDWNQPNITLEQLHTIKCPSLIICGDHDVISVEHTVLIYKNIPQAYLWVLPNSRHATLWMYPDEFNKKVDDFFSTPFHVYVHSH